MSAFCLPCFGIYVAICFSLSSSLFTAHSRLFDSLLPVGSPLAAAVEPGYGGANFYVSEGLFIMIA